ncbi:MAG: hypothetical protein CFE43_09285 [Burkholderiales bacterium PBB3]|nr:MAG: hypothetical protein CFE43_09285 [Burkholderiales bacterium PBB3]
MALIDAIVSQSRRMRSQTWANKGDSSPFLGQPGNHGRQESELHDRELADQNFSQRTAWPAAARQDCIQRSETSAQYRIDGPAQLAPTPKRCLDRRGEGVHRHALRVL